MNSVQSAGLSEQGNVRGNNEDRYHIDPERGIYLIVDGMGGQAAGEEAADIAVATMRARLERPTDSPDLRIREAIALANNAIFEAASANPAWNGMACVLTVALLDNGTATLGHVGDSRAYRISRGGIQKITRDHSPVGEQEDSGHLTEDAARKHPRRNEVYRDVGSQPRTPDDTDFVEIYQVPFTAHDALLLCSDGLSDVLPSRRMASVIETHAGDPAAALRVLVSEAVATGKDNVSAVLIEGDRFAPVTQQELAQPAGPSVSEASPQAPPAPRRDSFLPMAVALGLILAFAAGYLTRRYEAPAPHRSRVLRTGEGGFVTIPEAVLQAEPGDIVEVMPGTYPERVVLKEGTRLRGTDAAHLTGGITADDLQYAFVEGVSAEFISIQNSHVDLEDVTVAGTISFVGVSTGSLRHSRAAHIVVKEGSKPALEGNSVEPGR